MLGKKAGSKFTILLRDFDPRHVQVAEILNNLGYHGKAKYIVDAVLCYENHKHDLDALDVPHSSILDEKAVEALLKRLLRERGELGAQSIQPAEAKDECTVLSAEEINLDDALDVLSGDGFNAISDALEMFRSI